MAEIVLLHSNEQELRAKIQHAFLQIYLLSHLPRHEYSGIAPQNQQTEAGLALATHLWK